MKKIDYRRPALDLLFLLAGCVLCAFATTSILKPNGLTTGGITGISIIIDKLIYIKYTYIYYALSVLVLAIAWATLGKREGFKIITLSLVFPIILILFDKLQIPSISNDLMLASIYYGIISGLGCGLILKRGFSFGGTDTLAKILHHKVFPFISISELLLGIDAIIIISSAIIYGMNIALYAVISEIILMKAMNMVLFGFGSKKVQIEIISDKHEEITDYILHKMNRGVSAYQIKGGYMNLTRIKLVTICSPRESMLIKRFIAGNDVNAFVNVMPVMSVWGKGNGFDSLVDDV
ncbi:YitT family protein [Clostridium thailandense]|uniref:YitT family protein n=1 Tax=Clostridium thailandense TaxID=2794346 RepID=A0A949U0P2_9CLOT|nr:YitT family protein [Clostridium thailandense]MBV7276203.1 YitT family protein [Clostridium thailandense]